MTHRSVIYLHTMSSNPIFKLALDDVRPLQRILQEFHHHEELTLIANRDGIKFTTGDKTFEVSASFKAKFFQTFEAQKDLKFKFLLRDFNESLNLIRDDADSDDCDITSLRMQCSEEGDYLDLKLENKSNCLVSCQLKAFNAAPNHITISPVEDTAELILNSRRFYDYVSGLDLTTSDYVDISLSPDETPLKIVTKSENITEVELSIPREANDILMGVCISDNIVFSFNYKTQFVKTALEALKTSKSTRIICSSSGVLCIENIYKDEISIKHMALSEIKIASQL